MFYRINKEGNAEMFEDSGERVTSIPFAALVWPVNSDKSARYEHPEGIVLKESDAIRLGAWRES